MNTIDRKNNARENINQNIKHVQGQIKLLKNQKEYYEKKLKQLEKYDTFSKEEVKEIIEYLVSKIEQEEYKVEKLHVNVKSSSYRVDNMISEYTFLYLVKKSKKQEAINEIKKQYDIYTINDELYIKNSNDMENSYISDNYVKLSFYNKYLGHEMKFNSEKSDNIISINIIDGRFDYINNFIDELLNKKLDSRDFNLSISEMKLLIDGYVEKNTKTKNKIYTNN